MNIQTKSVIAALIFGGSISTASASAVITDITASGPGLGSFSVLASPTDEKGIDLSKVFDSVNPITLTFTVAHSVGNGGSYNIIESITNNTSTAFSDFHLSITEPTDAPRKWRGIHQLQLINPGGFHARLAFRESALSLQFERAA